MHQLVQGAEQQKSWIDWVGKFQRKIEGYRDFAPDQRKELLQGLLTSIEVHLMDRQTHWLEINFKIPLVGDALVYNHPSQKAKGYTVKEGQTALMLELMSRPYGKKKPIEIRA